VKTPDKGVCDPESHDLKEMARRATHMAWKVRKQAERKGKNANQYEDMQVADGPYGIDLCSPNTPD